MQSSEDIVRPGSRAALDGVGEATLEIFASSLAYNGFLWRRLNALSPVRGKVLEIGCGIGNITRLILKDPQVTSVHGIDMDPAYIERLLASLGGARLSASAAALEEFHPPAHPEGADGAYDAIVCSNVLEHIEDDARAVREFERLLRPGGEALVLVPAHPRLYSPLDRNLSHHRRYTPDRLDELARGTALELVRSRHFNPLAVLGWWWNGKVLGREALPSRQIALYSKFAIGVSSLLDRLNPFAVGISVIALFRKRREAP